MFLSFSSNHSFYVMPILLFFFFLLLHFLAQTFFQQQGWYERISNSHYILFMLIAWNIIGFIGKFDFPQNSIYTLPSLLILSSVYFIPHTMWCFALLCLELLYYLGKLFFFKENYSLFSPHLFHQTIHTYDFIALFFRLSLLNHFAPQSFDMRALLIATLALLLVKGSM